MTLRLMLLGLVASLGIDMPSGRDVSSWADSGRAWIEARCSAPADLPANDRDPAAESVADRAFEAIADGMAADFVADQVTVVEAAEPESGPVGSIDSDLALGLPEGEELAMVAPAIEEVAATADVEEPALTDAVDDETPTRADRLSSAVRMTRDAVHAWASLIQDSADEAEPTR